MTTPLVKICNAITRDISNYDKGKDYYNSPVDTALDIPTEDTEDSPWPFIRKEFLMKDVEKKLTKDNLTRFPHNFIYNYKQTEYDKRDLPVVVLYESAMMAMNHPKRNKDFPKYFYEYFEIKNGSGKDFRIYSKYARKLFLYTYAFLLSKLFIKEKLSRQDVTKTLRELLTKEFFQHADRMAKEQYDYYLEVAIDHYLFIHKEAYKSFSYQKYIPRIFNPIRNKYEKGRRFSLYGPSLLVKLATMEATSKRDGKEIIINSIDGQPSEFIESRKTKFQNPLFDIDEHGGRDIIILFVYCMVLEETLAKSQNQSVGLNMNRSEQVQKIKENLYEIENLPMETIEQINNLLREAKSKSVSRLMPSSSSLNLAWLTEFEIIQAFICHEPATDEESIYQQNYLHILIPADSKVLSRVIEIRASFFYVHNKKSIELPFLYIESYNGEDQDHRLCDGYYFLPDRQSDFPDAYFEDGILMATVEFAYACPIGQDETTAHVVVILTNPVIGAV